MLQGKGLTLKLRAVISPTDTLPMVCEGQGLPGPTHE